MEIIYLLQSVNHLHTKTTWRQLANIVEAMLSMTGRVTMLGISRWSEAGGSYRTIQRFFRKTILWSQLNFHLFLTQRYSDGDEVAFAGDHTVVTKSGKETHGLDYFFSSTRTKVVKGLEFFSLSFINITRRESSPVLMKQTVRSKKQDKSSPKKGKKTEVKTKKNEVVQKAVKTRIIVRLNFHLIYNAFKPTFSQS